MNSELIANNIKMDQLKTKADQILQVTIRQQELLQFYRKPQILFR